MAYLALYRKFRPERFEDVKGQDAIVRTLKNQIKADRIGHAYLFCGTRGTGKTTVAKIFAKAVNCEHPVDGSPCGECEMCRSIADGTSMNVIEIDAASNNGVDSIRQIRDEVAYRPTEGRYKVYIIDEVHMLSIGAFNALLKTLEEPPEYVIFILATTEVQKIPVTILSRCQRYDFRRIPVDVIADRLRELIDKEQLDVEDKAVNYIARAADGSMRDALSLLDQCVSFYLGERLTYEDVLEVLGAVDTEVFSTLLRQLLAMDTRAVLETVDELIMQGRELSQLASDFTWYLRNLLLIKSSADMEDALDMSAENLARLKEEARMIDNDTLMRYIREFSDLTGQLKNTTQKRVLMEVALIRLCQPAMETEPDALLDRVRAVEKDVEELKMRGPAQSAAADSAVSKAPGYAGSSPGSETGPAAGETTEAPGRQELPKALDADVKAVVKDFRSIAAQTSVLLQTYLKQARLSAGGGNRLVIVLPDKISANMVNRPEYREELEALIADRIGKVIEIDVEAVPEGTSFEDSYVDLEKYIKMEITVEDDDG